MMEGGLRKRHASVKQSHDGVEDKENNSRRKSSCSSLIKEEENRSEYAYCNVPTLETVDTQSNCDFDSLISSTCTSEDFQECSAELSAVKINKIEAALRSPVDRASLRLLARSEGGLINDVIRRNVWPELLEINNEESTFSATDDDIENHKEFHQVVLDVNRSLKRFPPGISNCERIILQDQLTKLILSVIIKHPHLCYYQGYHDVAVTLLLVVGDEKDNFSIDNADENEAEKFGALRNMQEVDIGSRGDHDVSKGKDQLSSEKSFPIPIETECKDGIEAKMTSVPETKQIKIGINGEEDVASKSVEVSDKDWLDEDGIAKKLRDLNIQTESKVQSGVVHTGVTSKANGEKSDIDSIVELNSKGNSCKISSLNGVKTGGGDNEGGGNFGEISDRNWDCWLDEKESVDSPESGHVICMWCSVVALKMLEHLSLVHFRGCMEPTMDATSRLLHHVCPIVAREDPMLCAFLDRSGVGTVYCLPWILTWYGHSLSNHDIVVRLYDYFLASPVTAPLYLAAAIILYRRKDILETECDMAAVHGLLSQIPDDLPFELLLSKASALYEAYPPESLQKDVEERSAKELQAREERGSKLGVARGSQAPSDSALIPWPLLAMLPSNYVNRLVPWFWLTRGRMRWLGAWARVIPIRHLNGRFVLAAIPFAMYYAYSHLASNTAS